MINEKNYSKDRPVYLFFCEKLSFYNNTVIVDVITFESLIDAYTYVGKNSNAAGFVSNGKRHFKYYNIEIFEDCDKFNDFLYRYYNDVYDYLTSICQSLAISGNYINDGLTKLHYGNISINDMLSLAQVDPDYNHSK
jgi:hypothetical protein